MAQIQGDSRVFSIRWFNVSSVLAAFGGIFLGVIMRGEKLFSSKSRIGFSPIFWQKKKRGNLRKFNLKMINKSYELHYHTEVQEPFSD